MPNSQKLYQGRSAFQNAFGHHFGYGGRVPAFELICERLAAQGAPLIIVETGCVRQEGNWIGDGQSTRIWDWLVSEHGGMLTSIDIDESACETAMRLTENCRAICADSVETLQELTYIPHVNLLYLDSYDWDGTNAAAEHHLRELGACWDRLEPGCTIAVDDCFSETSGKGSEILRHLAAAGVFPLQIGYITVWEKPEAGPTWKEILDASATK
jgi:hypothetical protein